MLFHTTTFWIFFAIVISGFYGMPERWRRMWLLVASYVFYMWWDERFAVLILASTSIDYFVGLRMSSAAGRRRKLLLLTSLAANLGILGFFKYHGFFVDSLAAMFSIEETPWALNVALPVGISFFTFQSMSYSIDVYRGILAPVRNFVDFALFVAFFPQLVAGPIVRAREFFPQLFAWAPPSHERAQRAIHLVLFGLIKKAALADRFAPIADSYFADPAAAGGALAAWTGVLAFGLQIYFDFSGYTDIARGCALLLGFEFPVNFRRPYLSQNITEFWQRWHISLSSWLRDYLYVPLGGNRHGLGKTYRNLMITMLLGGLWHGAGWTFVVWGGYHGLLLALHRLYGAVVGDGPAARVLGAGPLHPVRVAATFLLVNVGWVFFRAETFADAAQILATMFGPLGDAGSLVTWPFVAAAVVTAVLAILEERYAALSRLARAPLAGQVGLCLVCFWILQLFAVIETQIQFIYFQF